ncbi:putative WRKY transcription factor 35 [Hordeum vulgare]|nr:putative WRKY transcription factor 35 [Hordeum vulgare]
MAANLDVNLKWSHDEYVREDMERRHYALEENAEWRRGRNEGGVFFLSNSDEEETVPTQPVHRGDPGQGCSKGGKDPPSDDNGDDGDDDYTPFYKLLEIAERRRGRNKGNIIVLSDSDEDATVPTQPVRSGDPGQGCSKDDGDPSSDDDDDDGDNVYTTFYKLHGNQPLG